MDSLDDLLWGLLLLCLGGGVVLFANGASTGYMIIVGAIGAACGLFLIGRVLLRERRG